MNAFIIDDVAEARSNLNSLIIELCPEIKVIGEGWDIESAKKLIAESTPDVVFLDIDLGEDNAFELLEQIKPIGFKIIFVTAHNDYAIKAFKYSAVDYILKPIDPDELKSSVNKLNTDLNAVKNSLNVLIENARSKINQEKKVVLNTSDGIHVYRLNEIVRCESERNYSRFFFTESKSMLVAKTLGEYELMLQGDEFLRTHQSHLINLNHIKKYVKKDGGYLIMSNGDNVPVAQRKKTVVLDFLNSLS